MDARLQAEASQGSGPRLRQADAERMKAEAEKARQESQRRRAQGKRMPHAPPRKQQKQGAGPWKRTRPRKALLEESDRLRQQGGTGKKTDLRAQLLQQLNTILATRDTAPAA